MFKTAIGLAACLRGKHERDQSKIRREGETFFSRCRFCGTRMRRVAKRDWVVERGGSSR